MQKLFKNYFLCILTSLSVTTNAQPIFQWAGGFGGIYDEYPGEITVDDNGNVYNTGGFDFIADFDPGPGVVNLSSTGSIGIYVTKLDSSGNLVWARYMGGKDYDWGNSVRVDTYGNVYIIGVFRGTSDFDPGAGYFNLTSRGDFDIFICKLDKDGNFIWANQIGSAEWDEGNSIELDCLGNIVVTGYFQGTADFDPGPDTFLMTSEGINDIFVSKWDSSGKFIWTKQIGGPNREVGYSLAIDPNCNVYVTGQFMDKTNFNPGTDGFIFDSPSGPNSFICKFDRDGDFKWVKQIGEGSNCQGSSISIDKAGNIYSTGALFNKPGDFDPGPGIYELTPVHFWDAFISKLDPSGNFLWAKLIGGEENDWGKSIAIDIYGCVYYSGIFNEIVDFDPGDGVMNLSALGNNDAFISKLDAKGNFEWVQKFGSSQWDNCCSLVVDKKGFIYATGEYMGMVDFNTGTEDYILNAKRVDIYVLKQSQSDFGKDRFFSNRLFNLYPNPTDRTITILFDKEFEDVEISTYDITGKIIAITNFENQQSIELEIVGLPGVYLLKIQASMEKPEFVKVIKY